MTNNTDTTDAPSKPFEPDEMFEAFLASRTQSKTITRLARSSFYGGIAFRALYPIDAAAPPDIVAKTPQGPTGPVGPVSLRYRVEDVTAAESIVNSFDRDHPERSDHHWQRMLTRKRATTP